MTNDNGVVLTIGIQSSGEQSCIVLPIATETAMNADEVCSAAMTDFMTAQMALLCGIISTDAYVRFIQSEGMIDGTIPARLDFTSSDQPGTLGGGTVPNQVGGLMIFYSNPDDIEDAHRIRVGKNFVPGISITHVNNGLLDGTVVTALVALATSLQSGYTNTHGGGKWWRVCAVPYDTDTDPPTRPPGLEIVRTSVATARGYTGTQRRRLLPH